MGTRTRTGPDRGRARSRVGTVLLVCALFSIGGCGATPTASTSPSSSPSVSPADEATVRAAVDAAAEELYAAIGNPDTGSKSDDWQAFEAALESGDAASVRDAAGAVLAHLSAGRARLAAVAGTDWKAGAEFRLEWDQMLEGVAAGVTTMRDGALAGTPATVEAGRTRMSEAMQDHFWQALRGPSSPYVTQRYLAEGRTVTVSRMRWSTDATKAFDRQSGSAWTAGSAAPPQWIELDLGYNTAIVGVRMLTYQDKPGATDHRVTVRSATGPERELTRFTGSTVDGQWLEYRTASNVTDVQIVRVTTLATPSIVGWREIEVLLSAASKPGPCPSATNDMTAGARAMGEPSVSGNEPALVVDGLASTGWDAGPTRGPGNVRGWVRLSLARPTLVSEVRVLLAGPAGSATYTVTGWSGDRSVTLGTITGATPNGEWVSVPGPTPCAPITLVDVGVVSAAPAPAIREVRVMGTAAP